MISKLDRLITKWLYRQDKLDIKPIKTLDLRDKTKASSKFTPGDMVEVTGAIDVNWLIKPGTFGKIIGYDCWSHCTSDTTNRHWWLVEWAFAKDCICDEDHLKLIPKDIAYMIDHYVKNIKKVQAHNKE